MSELERVTITPPVVVPDALLHRSSVSPGMIAGRVMWSRTRHVVQDRMRAWWMARLDDGNIPTRIEAVEYRAHVDEQIAAELAAIEDGRPEAASPAVRVAYGIARDSARRAAEYDALESATRAAIERGGDR